MKLEMTSNHLSFSYASVASTFFSFAVQLKMTHMRSGQQLPQLILSSGYSLNKSSQFTQYISSSVFTIVSYKVPYMG